MSMTANPTNQQTSLWIYPLLLAMQTTGAVIVLLKGVPIYRQIAGDFASFHPQPKILWWALAAIALIQTSYWMRVRLQPPLLPSGHPVIGHLAAFVARISFILASSTFAAIFFVRFEQLSLPPHRIALVILLLFSMFCWTLELERLAKSLHGTKFS